MRRDVGWYARDNDNDLIWWMDYIIVKYIKESGRIALVVFKGRGHNEREFSRGRGRSTFNGGGG